MTKTAVLLESLLSNPELSVYRESLIEHMFIADLVQAGWTTGKMIQVAKSEIDAWGYDIILSCGPVVRYVQMKSSVTGVAIAANRALSMIPGACIVRVTPSVPVKSARISLSYRIFQAGPRAGLKLGGFKSAVSTRYVKSSTGTPVRKVRKNHVVVPTSAFGPIRSAEELVGDLFP